MEKFIQNNDPYSPQAKVLAARIFAQMQGMQAKGNLHKGSESWNALQSKLKELSTHIDEDGNEIAIPEAELRTLFSLSGIANKIDRDTPAEMARIAAKALQDALGFSETVDSAE